MDPDLEAAGSSTRRQVIQLGPHWLCSKVTLGVMEKQLRFPCSETNL